MHIQGKRHPKRVGLALVALIALAGSGCTSLTPPQLVAEAPEIPDSWQAPQSEAQGPTVEDLATWWQQLGDPVLDELVARTIAGNLDLQTAAARVKEARARRGLARADLGPSISAGVTAGRSESLGEGFAGDNFSASLDTIWEVDLFGANRLALAASQADLEAGIEDLHAAQVSLVAETVVAYADLRVTESRLQIVQESLASREETYRLATWREQAGLASRLDVSQAATSLEQTRAEPPVLGQNLTEAQLRLTLLAGELPGVFDELLATPAAMAGVPQPPDAVAAGIPAETLSQRPDVRSSAKTLDAALARLGVAEAARYPTLRLSGSLDGQSGDAADLFDADSFVANLLAGLTAPIFESGRIQNNIGIRETQAEQAALAYQSAVLDALAEVESALSSYQRSQERIVALRDAVQAAEEAAELADQRYAAGLADLLSVLDTQRSLLALEEQLVSSQGELVKNFSNLYRALGGGWSSSSERSVVSGGASSGEDNA